MDLAFDLVELVPCANPPAAAPTPAVREVAYRTDGWVPEELHTLKTMFAADKALAAIQETLGRPLHGIRSKIFELGLRRNSNRPWSGPEDTYVAQRYGEDATSSIAQALGRAVSSVYARASALGLTEARPPAYTYWEIAQMRAGYAQGVPVTQIAALIGRTVSGMATVASNLHIRHASSPPDWSPEEQRRALELAEQGVLYKTIAATMAGEGFPTRSVSALKQALKSLGYGRGWGRAWTNEEDDLMRLAYRNGDSLRPLETRLARSRWSINWRSGELGLRGTHVRPNGFCTERPWTEVEISMLRRDYGHVPTPSLATQLGRSKRSIYTRAHVLGIKHGFMTAFSADDDRAIHIAYTQGISLAGLSKALDRDVAVVSKHAIKLGIRFKERKVNLARKARWKQVVWTLEAILFLEDRDAAHSS